MNYIPLINALNHKMHPFRPGFNQNLPVTDIIESEFASQISQTPRLKIFQLKRLLRYYRRNLFSIKTQNKILKNKCYIVIWLIQCKSITMEGFFLLNAFKLYFFISVWFISVVPFVINKICRQYNNTSI